MIAPTDRRQHAVFLSGVRVGTLYRRGDATRFEFEPGYWDDPARLVLGLWFENNPSESPRASLRLPAWFSNLLPEGRLREWIADDRGVSTAREMELLLRIGHDLPGAVTVSEADDRVWREPGHSSAAQAPDASRQPAAWRFSLAGIGMKFSMLQRADRLTVPAVDELGDWIVKSPDGAHPHVPINEFAMMRLASRVGIDVPQIRLVDRSELPPLPEIAWPNDEHVAFAIERFDRGPAGSRIHIEDFAQVRGFFADQKYEGAFDTVAALAYRGQHLADLVEFTKRLTFNVLIGNGDAHLKNWSLLYADGRIPRLSPAYDLVSTGPYAPYPSEDMGLKLRGNRKFERVSLSDFDRLATRLNAPHAALGDVADQTIKAFETVWDPDSPALAPIPSVATWIDQRLPGIITSLRR